MGVYDKDGNPLSVSALVVSVKDFGAKGDGATDDATAIQSALDSLSTKGGIIFFPAGTYIIGSILYFYANQKLVGDNAVLKKSGSITAIITSAGDTTITGYNGVHDCTFDGLTFDGNDTQVTPLSFCHAQRMTIRNCIFKKSISWHHLEINSTKYAIVENCSFDASTKSASSGETIQIDGFGASGNFPWETGAVDGTDCKYVTIRDCNFYGQTSSADIGNHGGGGSYIEITGCRFDGNTSERGAIGFTGVGRYVNIHDNEFVGCTYGVVNTDRPALTVVHDNIFTGGTTPIVTSGIVAYNNFIDGTLSA